MGRLIEVEGDVSKPETGKRLVEETVREFGGLDVFVSNAGICEFAEFLEWVFSFSFPFPVLRILFLISSGAGDLVGFHGVLCLRIRWFYTPPHFLPFPLSI